MKVTFEWEGTEYHYDSESMDYDTAAQIKKELGMGLMTWQRELQDMDPDAINGLMFAIKRQNGELTTTIAKCQVNPVAFYKVWTEATLRALEELSEEKKSSLSKKRSTKKTGRSPTPTPTS